MILLTYNEYPFFLETIVSEEPLHGVFPDTFTDAEKNRIKSVFSDVTFLHNYDDNLKDTLHDLCERHKYSKIVAPREAFILLAGELRDKYGIPGQTLKSATCFRDKSVMKTALEQANLRVPKFKVIKNQADIEDYLAKNNHHYPLIIKPTSMSSSRNITVINSYDDILQWLTKYDFHDIDWEIEEFISGDFFHIDGLIQDGNVIAIWASKYTAPCGEITYDQEDFSYILPADHFLLQPLCSYAKKALQALQKYSDHQLDAAFHMELFYSDSKEIVFCEVGSRVGGGKIHINWSRAFGIDLYAEYVNLLLGHKINVEQPVKPKVLVGTVRIPTKIGVLKKIPSALPENMKGADGYVCSQSVGSTLNLKAKDGNWAYMAVCLITGKDEHEILTNMQNFKKWFYENTLIV